MWVFEKNLFGGMSGRRYEMAVRDYRRDEREESLVGQGASK